MDAERNRNSENQIWRNKTNEELGKLIKHKYANKQYVFFIQVMLTAC
jgi:hypothetical protein